MTHSTEKPSQSDFKTSWSVFEAKQQRKRDQLKTVPPSNFTENDDQEPNQ